MFSEYMLPNLSKWIQTINKQEGQLEERLSYLIFWSYLQYNSQQDGQIDMLDEISIIKQDSQGIILANYVALLIKYRRDYTHLLELLLSKIT